MPGPLVQLLADVDDTTAASAAGVLITKEEFKLDGWTVQDVRDVVDELRALARQDLGAGKTLCGRAFEETRLMMEHTRRERQP